jgi:CHAD domain-containing protein
VAKPKIEWDERRGAAANARSMLPRLVSDYFSEVRGFLSEDHPPAGFHRMRLAAKRLRYTLELFRPCYSSGFDERLATLKDLQDSLGEVNDAVATRKLLGRDAGRKERAFLKKRAAHKAREFRKHWAETFDAPGRELWWTTYLARK